MNPPTIIQLRTAIHVLQMLEKRIDNNAADSVMRLPDSRFGEQHAARIEGRVLEQAERIQTVVAQLESWCDELRQARRQCVSHHV